MGDWESENLSVDGTEIKCGREGGREDVLRGRGTHYYKLGIGKESKEIASSKCS